MPVPRISKEQLKEQLESNAASVAVVDARLKYPYEHSTVKLPGSIRVTPGSDDFSSIPRDRSIVVYDSDPNEVTASTIAGMLIKQGYRASVLEGGIAAWAGANLPVETKSAPKPAAPVKG
jgi:rhodanese-related sulfurtransferase